MSDASTPHDPPFDVQALLTRRRWLRSIARELVIDESRVDDLEQQIYLQAMERPPRGIRSLSGWLRSALRSQWIDAGRASDRREAREERAARDGPDRTQSTADLAAQASAQGAVSTAVAGLREPYRSTVLLRYFEGLPPRDIAERMGVPVETVRTRLKRAHAMLREHLDGEFGGDRRAWALPLLALLDGPIVPVPPTTGAAPIAAATGVVLVTKTTKTAIAVVVLALLAALTHQTLQEDDLSPAAGPQPVANTRGQTKAAPPKIVARGTLAGIVRRRADGLPAPAAEVVATWRRERVVVATDAEGRFELTGVAAGDGWELSARAPGFACEQSATADVSKDATTDIGTLWLAAAARLSVRVVGPDGAPLAQARVRLALRIPSGATAETQRYLRYLTHRDASVVVEGGRTTDASGYARFEDLPTGHRQVAVFHDRFVQLDTPRVRLHPGSPTHEITIRMGAGHMLTGRLLQSGGGPAAGVFVRASNLGALWTDEAWAQSDAEGHFKLGPLPAGDVWLYATRTRLPGKALRRVRVPDVSNVDLILPRIGEVFGRVTDESGAPLSGVEVAVAIGQHGAAATSDEEGHYRITGMPEGRLDRFRAWHSRRLQRSPRLVIGLLHETDGRSTTDDAEGRPAIIAAETPLEVNVVLVPGARVSGVVSGPDGPLAGAWVYRRGPKSRAGEEWANRVTDGDGRYEFAGLQPGRHFLTVKHPRLFVPGVPVGVDAADRKGELAPSHYVHLEEDSDVSHDLEVLAGPAVTGRVVALDGQPIEGARVLESSRGYSDAPGAPAWTDAEGAFRLPHVRPGTAVAFTAEADGFVMAAPVSTDIAEGADATTVEIRMRAPPKLGGAVVDGNGQALAGAVVRVRMSPSVRGLPYVAEVVALSGDDGRFEVALPYPTGTLTVSAQQGELGLTSRTIEVVESAPEPVELVLGSGHTVTGRVQLGSGQPVAGAVIHVRRPGDQVYYQHGKRMLNGNEPELAVASTDADGRFRVAGLEPGELLLVASAPSISEAFVTITRPDAPDEIRITASEPSSLAGVLEHTPGVPAANISVILVPESSPPGAKSLMVMDGADPRRQGLFRRSTDGEGRFDFERIPHGNYTLQAHLPGASRWVSETTKFGPLESGRRDLRLSLANPETGRIVGRVVDAAGRALSGVSVSASPDKEGMHGNILCRTDGSGRFVIEMATDPVYALTVQGDGVRRLFRGVRSGESESDFTLEPGLTITGALTDENGDALVGQRITVTLLPHNPTVIAQRANTDANGRFEIADLEDAEYQLEITPWQGDCARIDGGTLTAKAGTEDLALRASLDARIRGVIIDKSGQPIANRRIELSPAAYGYWRNGVTDDDGGFEFTGLDPEGAYFVSLDYGKGGSQTKFASRQAAASGQLDLRLEFPREKTEE